MEMHAPQMIEGNSITEAQDARTVGVNDAIDDLTNSCNCLHEVIEALGARLSPVLVAPSTDHPGDRLAVSRDRSVVAARINDEAMRVDNATDLLRGLLHRLDV